MNETPPIMPGVLRPVLGSDLGLGAHRADRSFAQVMRLTEPGRQHPPARDEAREAAEQLVSLVLVEPMLKQLRDSNQAAPPFAPTNGEKQFRAMLDADLARELTSAARFPLVDRLARELRGGLSTDAPPTAPTRLNP